VTTTVIINDFSLDRRTAIMFNHPQDFVQIEANWEREDKLLRDLGGTEAFQGKTRWCDLTPSHFRFLIMAALTKVADIPETESTQPGNQEMATLTFLLTGFIKCLEDRTESTIDLMRINRLSEDEILYDYAGSINMHFDSFRSKKKLRVIIEHLRCVQYR
jgi:hypothetical protein